LIAGGSLLLIGTVVRRKLKPSRKHT
jgi:hypothetical protein